MYFFRVCPDGGEWVAKRGARVLGRFETIVDAVDVAETEAATHRPSEVLYHDTAGHIMVIGRYSLDEA